MWPRDENEGRHCSSQGLFFKRKKKKNRVNKVHNTTAEPHSRTFFSFCGVQRSPKKSRCLLSNNCFAQFVVFFANLPTLAIKAGQLTCDFGFFFLPSVLPLNIIRTDRVLHIQITLFKKYPVGRNYQLLEV